MEQISIISQIQHKLKRKNYAESTQTIYRHFIEKYLSFCAARKMESIEGAEHFLADMIHQGLSISSQNQAINALKFYLEHILGLEKQFIKVDRPMKPYTLPEVLSLSEVSRLLEFTKNIKQQMILKTIYACGLRVGELLKLEIKDIDGKRKCIHIKQSKGRKDRIIPVPEELLQELRAYYKRYRPKRYLFEGQTPKSNPNLSKPYSSASVGKVIKRSAKLAGIRKQITTHTLRHSYATHLYEHGINLRSIQVLLGHNSSRTTEIYTHVSNTHIMNTPSPLSYLKDVQ